MKQFCGCGAARALLLWVSAFLPAASGAAVLRVNTGASRIEYHIDHSVAGVTNVAGTVSGTAETDSGGALRSGVVEVDLRELQTGIGMRDRHVKSEDCLDVERFPIARFILQPVAAAPDTAPVSASAVPESALASAAAAPPGVDSLIAAGSMELHGQTHPLRVPLQVTRQGGGLHVQGRFTFVLADWGIKRPKKLLLAAGKTVDVRLDLYFAP